MEGIGLMLIACDNPREHFFTDETIDSDECDAWCLRCQEEQANNS